MALSRELVEILVCPKCKGALLLRGDETAFECKSCRLVYAVIDGIPNFLIEEATALESA
jgi:uncharacterized protein YbaR (Trm112 family)